MYLQAHGVLCSGAKALGLVNLEADGLHMEVVLQLGLLYAQLLVCCLCLWRQNLIRGEDGQIDDLFWTRLMLKDGIIFVTRIDL